jgi:1-acyl-sn-glycerol-3-phosphate acyltransferase
MNRMSHPHASSPATEAPAPAPSKIPGASYEPADPRRPWVLGPRAPQTRGRLLRTVGWWILQRAGWRFEGQMPNVPKFVCIVAPHTSNWDFPVGLAVKWALGFDSHWWGKHTLFRPPLGWFMRANGGIPVDRAGTHNFVDSTVAAFQAHEQFALTLAPEGTRRKVQEWRSGFWHVARGANVPICCVAMDWGRKVIRLGPTVEASESDPAAGIARIRGLYADVRGYDPSQQT